MKTPTRLDAPGIPLLLALFLVSGTMGGLLPSALAESAPPSNSPILYIGDSISDGNFGRAMDSALRSVSSNVVSEASCGSTPSTWVEADRKYAKTVCGYWKQTQAKGDGFRTTELTTPALKDELATIKPKITVIQLGTNVAVGQHPSSAIASVQQMLQMVKDSGSACIWVGPPDANTPKIPKSALTQTSEMLKAQAAKYGCTFVYTQTFTHYPPISKMAKNKPDGIHPTPGLATEWGRLVAEQVLTSVYKDLGITPPSAVAPSTSGSVLAPEKPSADSATQ